MLGHFRTKLSEDGLAKVLAVTMRYWWLRSDGRLLDFYLSNRDIRDLTTAELRSLFPESTEDLSTDFAVYLQVWETRSQQVLDLWDAIVPEEVKATNSYLLASTQKRPDGPALLVYTGLVTNVTVKQRYAAFGTVGHPLMDSLWKNLPRTTLIGWQSQSEVEEVVEWMEFVVADLLGSYAWSPHGRGLNRQPGGPSRSRKGATVGR
jgi:hypothetical protein